MYNLTIDIGNTFTKTALFEGEVLKQYVKAEKATDTIRLANSDDVENIIISSVGKDISHYLNLIERKERVLVLNSDISLPIQLAYQNSHTLGVDRIAAIIGGRSIYKNSPVLVIDMGTCITYDFATAQNVYLGGAISPGSKLRFKSMHDYTAKLPLVNWGGDIPSHIGNSTSECLSSGVINGIIGELNCQIDYYRANYPGLKVILCGGDAVFFESTIKGDIFVKPELVMIGLNVILQHQKNINVS